MDTKTLSSTTKTRTIKSGVLTQVMTDPIPAGFLSLGSESVDPQIKDKLIIFMYGEYTYPDGSDWITKPKTFSGVFASLSTSDPPDYIETLIGEYVQTEEVIEFGVINPAVITITPVAPFQTVKIFYQILY